MIVSSEEKKVKSLAAFDPDDLLLEYKNLIGLGSGKYDYLLNQEFDMTGRLKDVENGKLSFADQLSDGLPLLLPRPPGGVEFDYIPGDVLVGAAFISALFATMADEALFVFDHWGILLKNPAELSECKNGNTKSERLFLSPSNRASRRELEMSIKILERISNSQGLRKAIIRRIECYDWAGNVALTARMAYNGYKFMISRFRTNYIPGPRPEKLYPAASIMCRTVRSENQLNCLDEIFRDGLVNSIYCG